MSRSATVRGQVQPAPEEETSPFALSEGDVSRPPTLLEVGGDRVFRATTLALSWLTVFVVFWVVIRIARVAMPAVQTYGAGFLTATKWDANRGQLGILPAIVGTMYSSVLGLIIATIFGLAIALFLSEKFLSAALDSGLESLGLADHPFWGEIPARVEDLLKLIVELLAAIPSVVYGLWGIFIVIPLIRPVADWLHLHLGWVPFFGPSLSGPGLLPAALVLAIMVLPTISAISRDALAAVPPKLREAAFGLGATRWEAILAVFVPTAATGIFGAIILGFGRALGETMALAMLAGNANVISWSLFSPANTLAALLANHFPEADQIEVGALMYAALVLLAITLIVNVAGTLILQRADAGLKGLR